MSDLGLSSRSRGAAEDLEAFNNAIIGQIEVVAEFG